MNVKPALQISPARDEDLPDLAALLNHHIVNTTAVALSKPLDGARQQQWFAYHAPQGPYRILTARDGDTGRLLGFVQSSPLVPDKAFGQTAVISFYCASDATSQGIGGALLAELLRHLTAEKLHRAYANTIETNTPAAGLLRKFGFAQTAVYDEVAFKFGRYWNMTVWEKKLDETTQE